jgi:dihydrofolate reductase
LPKPVLPGRISIVVSRTAVAAAAAAAAAPDIVIVPSLEKALEVGAALSDYLFVVGGAALYAEALSHPLLDTVFVTRIPGTYTCDRFLPRIDFPLREQFMLDDGSTVVDCFASVNH